MCDAGKVKNFNNDNNISKFGQPDLNIARRL